MVFKVFHILERFLGVFSTVKTGLVIFPVIKVVRDWSKSTGGGGGGGGRKHFEMWWLENT